MSTSPGELPRETEVKFRVGDRAALEAGLRALGATAGKRGFETNLLLDDAAGSMSGRGVALRVRETDGAGLVTFKGPREVRAGVRTRVELETGVADAGALLSLFAQLGFRPVFRYEKFRTTWRFDDPEWPEVVVDETPIGLFAEIEGDESSIRMVAGRLGVREDEFLESSYVALYLAARAANPALPSEMVFP